MRLSPAIIAAGLALLIVVGLLIDSPWSSGGGGAHSKSSLVSQIARTMEESNAPPAVQECMAEGLEDQLSEAEVSHAYDKAPTREQGAGTGITEIPPALRAQVARVGLLCMGKLIRSGRYNSEEVTQMMRRMGR